jgi:FixJ family two-component response regulator
MQARAFPSAQLLFDALLDGNRVDCLILDVHMPEVSGLDVQAWLRDHDLQIPTIMITGREDAQMRARSLALGARAYLCKPMESDVLLRAIESAVDQ